jgi:phospholipid/cholesterol/gamma-HCH transport system substrate-binding protein
LIKSGSWSPSDVDAPERPAGELYCRLPQDSTLNVRGVRNIPCENNPAKRAPTVELCESDEQYVPFNDGFNWKGDPNATLSGQGVPQYAPGQDPRVPPPPTAVTAPLVVAPYDPDTGDYLGPDGKRYTQGNLAHSGAQTWQSMLTPPA